MARRVLLASLVAGRRPALHPYTDPKSALNAGQGTPGGGGPLAEAPGEKAGHNAIPTDRNAGTIRPNAPPPDRNVSLITRNGILISQTLITITQNGIPISRNGIPISRNGIPISRNGIPISIPPYYIKM
ncbi:MAG: hypothetical protein H7330_16505 [Hymenobacteraceae bacterium]|nr:hypothetical protein [Hymenobacteraceae bacterium]